jgi:PAS domain S-box-containing protein
MNVIIGLHAVVTVVLAVLVWRLCKSVESLQQTLHIENPKKRSAIIQSPLESEISSNFAALKTDTESKLRSYLKIMDTLINTIPNPICYMDLEGLFLGCNQAFAKSIIGLTRDRIIGKKVTELSNLIPSDLASCLNFEKIQGNINEGEYSFESEITCADDHNREYMFTIAGVFDSSGNMNGTVMVMQDLTDKNRAARHRLQSEKLQGVLEIAGAVCHELNQPLQALSGYVELAEVEMTDDDSGYSQVQQMRKQIDRMASITGKLQGITRYETMDYIENTKILDIEKSSDP